MLAFYKYEGTGNDFVVVEREVSPAWARAACDRRRGIGADGVLMLVPPSDSANAGRMRIVNADGSIPEMCGNGLRCVALHWARGRSLEQAEATFETDAGLRRCTVDDRAGRGTVRIDMGEVRVLGEKTLDAAGDRVALMLADAGNPHAITWGDYGAEDHTRLGPALATHSAFPRGTNVEFVREGRGGFEVVVWERGVGLTEACGTGACAVVAAACALGRAPRGSPVTVTLPGGALEVTIDARGHAILAGPARHVFSGHIAL